MILRYRGQFVTVRGSKLSHRLVPRVRFFMNRVFLLIKLLVRISLRQKTLVKVWRRSGNPLFRLIRLLTGRRKTLTFLLVL